MGGALKTGMPARCLGEVAAEDISADANDTSEGCSEDCDSVVVDPERVMAMMGEVLFDGAERGALSLTMETTIFSKSSELMWRSRRLAEDSSRRILGRISRGADTEVNSGVSSSARESTLPES